MEIVKMFDVIEIREVTGIDVLKNYWGDFCNDVAIPWYVGENGDNENYKKIDNYFLTHGATIGEKVWIDVTW